MILKNPEPEDLEMLKDGSVYFTMLHYATRPKVREIIARKGLRTFAMDHIVDDNGLRIFADYFGTAFNACQEAVEALKEVYQDYWSVDREPIKALVMGVGGVGQNCIRSLEILSDKDFLGKQQTGILPIICTRTITGHPEVFDDIIKQCHLVVDATQRRDETLYVMTNRQIGLLPEDAVLLDICADRYDFGVNPPLVKGMDQQRSVQVYYGLMKNYVGIILTKEYEDIHEDSDNLFERGLYRSTYTYFMDHWKK